MEQQKAYYAIIPANVRYDKSIPMGAKLLYGEITALCNQEGFCWATNKYFTDLYDVGERTIIRWISSLEERGYIIKNIEYEDDGKTVIRRCLSISNVTTPPDKNVTTPPDKNVTYNNTNKNNTDDDKGTDIYLKQFLERYPLVQVDCYGTGQLSLIDFAELLKRFEESEYLRLNCNSLQWIVRNRSSVMSGKYKDREPTSNQQGCKPIVDGSLYKII